MGRPRRFDESELLDAATELFWSRGFDDTSVEDVSRATGIGNGSIYAAYGSKRGLFLAAYGRYCERRAAIIREVMESAPGSPRDAVRALYSAVLAGCAEHQDRRGCLMLNSIAGLGVRIPEVVEIGAAATAVMERAVAERLTVRGDVDADIVAAQVVLVAQGLIQGSRLGMPRERLEAIADVSAAGLPIGDDVPVS
ncbi:TetR/AcrR family transcriptional regulator [Nocardia sp. NPDC057353]|uniref:TetR/AcrR family transcriptional regulator n=1 Tax=Nocardia sp. NPDC057353 TaxID=3346104 RepID=UPI003635471C